MATLESRHLVDLMIEANVDWPEDAEYAAQDKHTLRIHFYSGAKPTKPRDWDEWKVGNGRIISRFQLQSLCYNWHQTIVTRERYAKAIAKVKPIEQIDTQQKPEYCASVMRQMPNNTIEQLTADYYAKAAEAQRQQIIADEARKIADDALLALEKAGELLGLIISINTNK